MSLTGRMSHNAPTIQRLPVYIPDVIESWEWKGDAVLMENRPLRAGELVVWEPTGEPGLWLITDIRPSVRGSFGSTIPAADYSAIEHRVLRTMGDVGDLSEEEVKAALAVHNKKYRRRRHYPQKVPLGKLRLVWEGGWGGYCNDGRPVIVEIDQVRRPNEMEALALAAL